MWNVIKQRTGHWIHPSIRADSNLLFRVQIGLVLGLFAGGTSLIGTTLVYFTSQDHPFPLLPFMAADALLVAAGLMVLSKKWVTPALMTITLLASAMMIYAAYLTGGLGTAPLMSYPVNIILASILSGRRTAAAVATACILSLVGFWYLSHIGHHFPATEALNNDAWVLAGGGAVALAGAIVFFTMERNETRQLGYEAEIARRTKVEQSLRHAQQRLRMAKTAAEAGSEAKGAFLTQISHEIRNPLTAIMGGIDLLALPADAAKTEERIKIVQRSANTLFEFVEDVNDYSNIVQRQVKITPMDIDIVQMIGEIERSYRSNVIDSGIELFVDIAPTVPTTIWMDPIRVRQVLVNLIDNAFKFTTEGSVTIEVSPTSHEDGTPVLMFGIEDTGIGIADTFYSHLFEPYKQGNRGTPLKYGGIGLGLPICYHLVTLMHGQLGFETEVDEGSRFWFSLPIEQQPDGYKKKESSEIQQPVKARVLLVENDPLNRQIVGELIESLGHTVTLAEGGREAIEKYQYEPPNLVLMDIRMPGLDGIAATRKIREWEDEQEQSHVPILAMTADLEIRQISNYGAAGMNGLLSKPVTRDKLEEAIQGWAVRHEPELGK
jgi:signal transduction histidine kinase/ActR/RegA family two-component response regulator